MSIDVVSCFSFDSPVLLLLLRAPRSEFLVGLTPGLRDHIQISTQVELTTVKHLTTVDDSGAHFEDCMLLDVCDAPDTAAQTVLAKLHEYLVRVRDLNRQDVFQHDIGGRRDCHESRTSLAS